MSTCSQDMYTASSRTQEEAYAFNLAKTYYILFPLGECNNRYMQLKVYKDKKFVSNSYHE